MPKMIRPNLSKDKKGQKSKDQRRDIFTQIRFTEKWIKEAKDPDHIAELKEHLWRLNQRVK